MTGVAGGTAAGEALAEAAAVLVGCRFRLHGRDPATGLDCLGVLAAAMAATGRTALLPTGYALRTDHHSGLDRLASECGLTTTEGRVTPGEVWLLRPGPGQWHVALVAPDGASLIEAHAGLRRVVRTPLTDTAPALPVTLLRRWRPASA